MLIDLPALVRQALLAAGCAPDKIAGLDPHSPIELAFAAMPPVLLDSGAPLPDGVVRLNCRFERFNAAAPSHAALSLMETITAPASWSVAGCALEIDQHGALLQALCMPTGADAIEHFAEALEDFHARGARIAAALAG